MTPEQKAQLDVYAERFIELGCTTKPVELDQATSIIDGVYKKILQKPVPKVELAEGPISAWKRVVEHERRPEDGDEQPGFIWPYLDGQFSAGYFAWVTFMKEVMDQKLPEGTEEYLATIGLGPIYPLDTLCVVCQTPLAFHRNRNGLHKDGGPAIEYRDGLKIWALNGVRVEKWLAETPAEQLDPQEFAKITNVEIRREFIRKVGIERLVEKLGAEVVDTQDNYELLLVNLGGETGKWPYLKMKNPSIGVYHLEAVDKDIKTVKKALEWRNQSAIAPSQLT
jgi:hypothetical protein